ncbi:MAG: response regulator [Candidatus Melainabacteria bacterium]|nr:response regulator [Candidatus Melainabacteria bacterium]
MIDILLLEDNLGDEKLVEEMLLENNNDFHLTCARKLSEGIKYLEKNAFDVILLDLTLPDSTGFNSLTEIKIKAPETPIIILTGSIVKRPELKKCLDNVDTYLVKGEIDSNSLVSAITNAVQNFTS